MKCYELPGGENEDDLKLSLALESDSDTEACTTDDELSADDKSSSGEESEENENGKLEGVVLYLSKPGTSFWDSWRPLPPNDSIPSGVHCSQLALPPVNFYFDNSLADCSDQHVATRVHRYQNSPSRDCSNRYAPHYWHQDSCQRNYYRYNAPSRVPRDRLNWNLSSITLPRSFHNTIYNRDEFLARQNNPNHRRNFETASNIYQSYWNIPEEVDNERAE